jgi:hypothetical protein
MVNAPGKKQETKAMKAFSLAGLTALLLLAVAASASAEPDAIMITILATFDVGTGNSTTPFSISSRGDIAGYYTDAGITFYRGFIRLANGRIISPIIDPSDNGNYTAAFGINSSQTVVGEFLNIDHSNSAFHGFFLSHGVYTQYDVDINQFSTGIFGINDAGDFDGSFGNSVQPDQGFISIGGNVTTFAVPGSYDTFASSINAADQIAGYYDDQSMVLHGFFRDSNGTITYPIDPHGATYSVLLGINDSGIMVGRYADANGVHGMIFKAPHSFVTYDYAGAIETSFNGINRHNMITGRYTDSNGIRHGFVAKVSTH